MSTEDTVFWLCIVVMVFGVLALAVVFIFGAKTFQDQGDLRIFRYIDELLNGWLAGPPTPHGERVLQAMTDSLEDFRERRNEFWTTYGQIVLSMFIVTVLAVLLLTKTIERGITQSCGWEA